MPSPAQRNLARDQAAVTRTVQALPGRVRGPKLGTTNLTPGYTRDHHKSKVYEAESHFAQLIKHRLKYPTIKIEGVWLDVPDQLTFGDLTTVQTYVDKVTAQRGASRVTVRASEQLSTKAHYKGGVITLPLGGDDHRWAWTQATVLHEITHHLHPTCDHNSPFPGTLAELFTDWISPEAGMLMTLLFISSGITL